MRLAGFIFWPLSQKDIQFSCACSGGLVESQNTQRAEH